MTNEPLVSFVIGVRNMEKTIGKTIESIFNQTYPNKEVIVINDGSDDDTEKIIKNYPVRVFTTNKMGISNARNFGYQKSNGDYIAFTDADCELDKNWTINILNGFKNDKVGLVGGKTVFQTDTSYTSFYRYLEFTRRYNNIKNRQVFWAGGPGFIFKRQVLDEVGGFNPRWIHGEDSEISLLIIEHGYKIQYQSNAITYHIPESGFWKLVKKGYRDAKAHARVSKRHKTYFQGTFLTKWFFPLDLVYLPILYLFLLISIFFNAVYMILNFFFNIPSLPEIIINMWNFSFLCVLGFCMFYSLIPTFSILIKIPRKKFVAFFGTFILHNVRCFAWGLGLLVGFKNLLIKRDQI